MTSIVDTAALREEVERLRDRLEMTHAWRMVDGKMTRVEVELGSIPDGIECRDETIRLQDRRIDKLRAEVERRRADDALVDELVGALELAAKAIRMVINNRPENESAPTNLGLASVEAKARALLAKVKEARHDP